MYLHTFVNSKLNYQTKTMKKVLLFTATAALLASCGGGVEGDKVEAQEAQEVKEVAEAVSYTASPSSTTLNWEGSDVAGKVHTGSINITEGNLEVKEESLVGGSFTIDMSSIVNFDVENPEYNAKLVGHLKSPDFFSVDSFPMAKFEIVSVSDYQGEEGYTHNITGNLTMKDITKSITFPASVSLGENSIEAKTAKFVFDRSEWNVRFRSPSFFDIAELKDKAINNEIGLEIAMVASK